MTNILGVSAFYHDSAAAIVCNGQIIAAAQEERFTRKKHDDGFPTNAIKYCLEEAGLTIDQLDAVVFYDKPLLKFERLLETYYNFAPLGLRSFMTAIPVWIKQKMFLKDVLLKELGQIDKFNSDKLKLLFPEHHLSHMASAYYPAPYPEAAIVTIDGVGEWATTTIAHGNGKDIKVLKELHFTNSVGLLYSAFTYYLGFRVNSGEYKLMGLAPYGDPDSEAVKNYIKLIKKYLVEVKDDGSIQMDQRYYNYAVGLTMVKERKWAKLFGFPRRKPESKLEQKHCDLALAIQKVTEEIVLKIAQEAKNLTNSQNLCLAGGVALNCVANGKLQNAKIFQNIYIQPAAGDAGGALGAALAANHIYYGREKQKDIELDLMKGSYLGPEFTDAEAIKSLRKYHPVYKQYDDFSELAQKTAALIGDGYAVGWFQGRMEFGPRALGARSILGDARNSEMQKKLNLKIKYRESFRPFAPSVLAEETKDYFELDSDSPYMLLVQNVLKKRLKKLPANYNKLPLMEKLYILRSDLPAITHIDFSARVQTVHKETNPRFWDLIQAFKKLTGYSVVVNTSFNVRGEPIVCTPEDAYKCLMRTEMDYLVIGNLIFAKKDQPVFKDTADWRKEYKLD